MGDQVNCTFKLCLTIKIFRIYGEYIGAHLLEFHVDLLYNFYIKS